MRRKTTKLLNLEKNRYSVFTDDLEHCILCGKGNVDINEIFMGRNRRNSMKYGLCIPLCREHHRQYHNSRTMQLKWFKLAQNKFEEIFVGEDWLKIFYRNYKD